MQIVGYGFTFLAPNETSKSFKMYIQCYLKTELLFKLIFCRFSVALERSKSYESIVNSSKITHVFKSKFVMF